MQQSSAYIARLSFVALLSTIANSVPAQSPAQDSRWAPWIGCWQPVMRAESGSATSSIICVAPSGANAVEVATIDSGKVLSRDTIDASGTQTPLTSQGCSGWRSGQWSADGRRVYLRSELNCSGNIKRVSTGVLAFWERYGWLDVQTVRSGSSQGTRSTRYVVAEPASVGPVPAEYAGILRAGTTFDNIARMLAGSEVKLEDVVDASKHVDAAVVETWLTERAQPFKLDGKTLAKLADAGVPGSVTDVMIGVTYTERFTLSRGGGESQSGRAAGGGGGGGSGSGGGYVFLDSNGCQMQTYRSLPMDDGCYRSAYGYGTGYDYGYGYGGYYGYGSYGYRSPVYTNYSSSPVVVVDRNSLPHGTLVNGSGYTRGSPPDGGSRSGSSGDPPTTGKSSGSSTTGSGSSSSGGRTAHKKGG